MRYASCNIKSKTFSVIVVGLFVLKLPQASTIRWYIVKRLRFADVICSLRCI